LATTVPQSQRIERRLGALGGPSGASLSHHLLSREVNERIALLRDSADRDRELSLVCECDRRSCTTTLRLLPDAYEELRRFPTRFAVSAGHINDAEERPVMERRSFVIIEKLGASAPAAIRADPRKRRAASAADDAAKRSDDAFVVTA
jgi:hypothetical protein